MKEYQEIRDTSPLSMKVLNDQIRLLWFKARNTTTKDIRDDAVTINKIASDVGESLDLTSNESINLIVSDIEDVEGRIVTAEGSISVMAGQIELKASSSFVSSLETRLSSAEIDINGLESQITLKADSSIVTDLETRLSGAEIKINGLEGQISLKASTSTVNGLSTRVSSAEIVIDGLEGQINLKANSSTVTALESRVSTAEVDINGLESQITLKADSSIVTDLETRLSGAEIDINGLESQIALKANTSIVTGLSTKVTAAEIKIDGLEGQINLKANSSTVTDLGTRVSSAEVEINGMKGEINLKVGQSDLTNAIDGIEVGSVNLVLDSNRSIVNTGDYLVSQYSMSEDWEPNTEYTIQIKGAIRFLTGGNNNWAIYANGETIFVAMVSRKNSGIATLTFTTPSSVSGTTPKTFRLYNFPNSTHHSADVEWIKLEKGNKATGWNFAEGEIEGVNYKFGINGFELKDNNNQTLITPLGLLDTNNIAKSDNVTSGYPLSLRFYIDDQVNSVDKVFLRLTNENFRAYSTAASSGGGSTSGASSKSTSDSGGSTTPTSGSPTQVTVEVSNSGTTHGASTGTSHTHGFYYYSFPVDAFNTHKHNVTVKSHSHGMAHTHSTPSHTHGITYGLYENANANNAVTIFIDGVQRATTSTKDASVNLSSWITTKGWHTVELRSTVLKRISASLFVKSYIQR